MLRKWWRSNLDQMMVRRFTEVWNLLNEQYTWFKELNTDKQVDAVFKFINTQRTWIQEAKLAIALATAIAAVIAFSLKDF